MKKQLSRRSLLGSTAALGVAGFAKPASADEDTTSSNPMVDIHGRSDAKPNWLMPAHFGPIAWEGERPVDGIEGESLYRDVTVISLKYLTDEVALRKYLPERFELDGPPLISVSYSQNRDISWLAGGQYNIVSVTAQVKFNGEKDALTGAYALVLWENLTEPILVGREALGIPKIHGDIEDHRISNGVWSTRLSKNGSTILDLRATDAEQLSPERLATVRESAANGKLLGWKYIPDEIRIDPIVSYATLLPSTNTIHEAWSATGSLEWHSQEWKTNPTQHHIVNALASLPKGEIESCTIMRLSKTLLSGKARRLE